MGKWIYNKNNLSIRQIILSSLQQWEVYHLNLTLYSNSPGTHLTPT
jgi:hypothetical protein